VSHRQTTQTGPAVGPILRRETNEDRLNYERFLLIKRYVERNETFRTRLLAIAASLEPAYEGIVSHPDSALEEEISRSTNEFGRQTVEHVIDFIRQNGWPTNTMFAENIALIARGESAMAELLGAYNMRIEVTSIGV